jgi:hypothetical protein
MERESPETEVLRLLKEQNKARQDEVFGGLSTAERADYNRKAARILELETCLGENIFRSRSAEAKARQSDGWDQTSETDTPQSRARQPYRDREKDSRNSRKKSKKQKNAAADGGVTDEE